MTVHEHRANAPSHVRVAVLTVSTSRPLSRNASGALIEELIRESGHHMTEREVVGDDAGLIREALSRLLATGAQAVVITGGTGVTPSDVTIEAVQPLFEKELPAFGTLFAQLSYAEIGAAAILSRATAGVLQDAAVFCIPGSPKACRLAMERIILPELTHLIGHIRPAEAT